MKYFDELTRSMSMLADHPKTLFIGQSIAYDGQRAHASFAGVPAEKRIEMPICEDFTIGYCTGLALEGYIPVCFIPRFDFLLLACNALVNHLDKIRLVSDFRPKVIIRTAVGASKPLDPGPQHTQDYVIPFRQMLKTVPVHDLRSASWVYYQYERALACEGSMVIVEHMENYSR